MNETFVDAQAAVHHPAQLGCILRMSGGDSGGSGLPSAGLFRGCATASRFVYKQFQRGRARKSRRRRRIGPTERAMRGVGAAAAIRFRNTFARGCYKLASCVVVAGLACRAHVRPAAVKDALGDAPARLCRVLSARRCLNTPRRSVVPVLPLVTRDSAAPANG